jgi:hypothetical protein
MKHKLFTCAVLVVIYTFRVNRKLKYHFVPMLGYTRWRKTKQNKNKTSISHRHYSTIDKLINEHCLGSGHDFSSHCCETVAYISSCLVCICCNTKTATKSSKQMTACSAPFTFESDPILTHVLWNTSFLLALYW